MNKLYVETETKIYFHPAYHLIEIFDYEPFKKDNLAKYLDETTIENFLEGKIDVDEEIATALELADCAPKYFWLNLQKLWERRLEDEE